MFRKKPKHSTDLHFLLLERRGRVPFPHPHLCAKSNLVSRLLSIHDQITSIWCQVNSHYEEVKGSVLPFVSSRAKR